MSWSAHTPGPNRGNSWGKLKHRSGGIKPWVLEYHHWPQFDPCPHVILSETVNPVSINPYHVLYDDWVSWVYEHYLDTPVQIDLSRAGQIRFSTKAAAMHFKLAWAGR